MTSSDISTEEKQTQSDVVTSVCSRPAVVRIQTMTDIVG